MTEVKLRDFLRNYKAYMPFPKEGIKVVSRDEPPFYVCPNKPETEVDKLKAIAQFIVQEMGDTKPPVTAFTKIVDHPEIAIPVRCEASRLMPWETTACENKAFPFLVADTSNGEPMGESDWKPINLCNVHKSVAETIGGFALETP